MNNETIQQLIKIMKKAAKEQATQVDNRLSLDDSSNAYEEGRLDGYNAILRVLKSWEDPTELQSVLKFI